ncbi:hypothetical protein HOT49_gp186 [Erwinia phage vB_EamM_Alexandra]|uniref:Uncharacterized protein n=1 Tax=Erwinia phage vB_EamM_Alexandra TaxID=2201424 RepID=A0A2Z4QFG4_9CAUD|nr:hypothetical protein HOT49_gp186 [Erwinia phage vB_EamM_Alexandra]AWY08456.1 hypothetical protein Alexandra_188 [Erwinia phage vB_EamM_Alexandra]
MAKTAKNNEVSSISASVDYGSGNMTALRQARTAKEFRNVLDAVISQATSVVIPKKLLSVSASPKAVELADLEGTIKGKQAKAIDLNQVIDLSKIDISDVRSKAQYNNQVSQLSQAIGELSVAYQILSSKTFSAFKDQNAAAKSLLSVIEQAKDQQQKLVRLMSIDVKNGAPKEHTKLAATIANYLSKILNKEDYSKIRTRTFIASGTDPICFQTYVFIDNFVNSDGLHYPNYALVLSTTIAVASGISENFLTSLVDEKVPGSFPMGRLIGTAPEMKRTINQLMAVDGFLNYSERKPINRTTQNLRDTTQLGNAQHMIRGRKKEIFDNVRVQNDSLYVRLVPGLSPTEKKEAITEILGMASTVLRAGRGGKNSVIHQIVNGRNGRELVKISLTGSGGTAKGVLTLRKIDEISEVMGLNPAQKRLLKQSVK